MEFLHAAALWGLGLAAVPIIIHLITRKRALKKPYAAMRFVLLSHRRVKRGLRIKRLLILLARILAVVALALLVAHPMMEVKKSEIRLGDAPRSVVVLVDNSMSMFAGNSGKRPFDEAITLAGSIIKSLGPGQEAAIAATNPNPTTMAPNLTAEPTSLEKALKTVKISFVYKPLADSIAEASALLETAHHDLKQIILITDLQRAPWVEGGAAPTGAKLIVIDVGVGAKIDNAAVSNVGLEPLAGEALYNARISVASFASKPTPGRELSVLIGAETRARGFVDLPNRGQTEKTLNFSAAGAGILRGAVQLSPDALEYDNRRFFTASSGGRISAVVVDGDPKAEQYGAESYYLMNALNPKLEARSRIDPVMVTMQGVSKINLDNFNIVILANVGTLDQKQLETLKKYVSSGGSLIIGLGNNADPKTFGTYGDLAPAALYVLKELPAPTRLDPAISDHPLARMFTSSDEGNIALASFYKYFLLDPAGEKSGAFSTVMRYQDGAPALVEKSYGLGKVALWTSSLDKDWNDLCIYPTYLPLLQQLALYLTGGMVDPMSGGYLVGDSARLQCSAGVSAAFVSTPENVKRRIELAAGQQASTGTAPLTDGPGFYEIYCAAKSETTARFDREPDKLLAVNVDLRESDLEKWDVKAFGEFLKQKGFPNARVAKNVAELAGDEGFKRGKRDAARLMITALAALLLLEAFLIRKG